MYSGRTFALRARPLSGLRSRWRLKDELYTGAAVWLFDFARLDARIAGRVWPLISSFNQGLSVTRDGKYLYFVQTDTHAGNVHIANWP